jgi:hypothetical protein
MGFYLATVKISDACWPFLDYELSTERWASSIPAERLGKAFGNQLLRNHPEYRLQRADLETLLQVAEEVQRGLIVRGRRSHPVICELEPEVAKQPRRQASALFTIKALINRVLAAIAECEDQEQDQQQPQPAVWECPICDTSVTTLLPVLSAPTCSRHTGGGRLMTQKEGN